MNKTKLDLRDPLQPDSTFVNKRDPAFIKKKASLCINQLTLMCIAWVSGYLSGLTQMDPPGILDIFDFTFQLIYKFFANLQKLNNQS